MWRTSCIVFMIRSITQTPLLGDIPSLTYSLIKQGVRDLDDPMYQGYTCCYSPVPLVLIRAVSWSQGRVSSRVERKFLARREDMCTSSPGLPNPCIEIAIPDVLG
jgi:hypothetical protein